MLKAENSVLIKITSESMEDSVGETCRWTARIPQSVHILLRPWIID
jgi:hypothetical protein